MGLLELFGKISGAARSASGMVPEEATGIAAKVIEELGNGAHMRPGPVSAGEYATWKLGQAAMKLTEVIKGLGENYQALVRARDLVKLHLSLKASPARVQALQKLMSENPELAGLFVDATKTTSLDTAPNLVIKVANRDVVWAKAYPEIPLTAGTSIMPMGSIYPPVIAQLGQAGKDAFLSWIETPLPIARPGVVPIPMSVPIGGMGTQVLSMMPSTLKVFDQMNPINMENHIFSLLVDAERNVSTRGYQVEIFHPSLARLKPVSGVFGSSSEDLVYLRAIARFREQYPNSSLKITISVYESSLPTLIRLGPVSQEVVAEAAPALTSSQSLFATKPALTPALRGEGWPTTPLGNALKAPKVPAPIPVSSPPVPTPRSSIWDSLADDWNSLAQKAPAPAIPSAQPVAKVGEGAAAVAPEAVIPANPIEAAPTPSAEIAPPVAAAKPKAGNGKSGNGKGNGNGHGALMPPSGPRPGAVLH